MVVYEYGVFNGVNKVKTLVDTYVADKFFPEGEHLYRVVDDKAVGIVDTSGEFDMSETIKANGRATDKQCSRLTFSCKPGYIVKVPRALREYVQTQETEQVLFIAQHVDGSKDYLEKDGMEDITEDWKSIAQAVAPLSGMERFAYVVKNMQTGTLGARGTIKEVMMEYSDFTECLIDVHGCGFLCKVVGDIHMWNSVFVKFRGGEILNDTAEVCAPVGLSAGVLSTISSVNGKTIITSKEVSGMQQVCIPMLNIAQDCTAFYLDVIEDVKYTPHDYNLEKVLIGELQEIISNQDVRQDYLNAVSALTSKLPETQRNGTTPIRTLLGLLESLT